MKALSDPDIKTIITAKGSRFLRPLATILGNDAAVSFFTSKMDERPEQEFVTTIMRGRIWGYAHGAVFTKEGGFISAFARDPWGKSLHAVWVRPWLPRSHRLPGRTLYLVTPEAADNYHHWLIDLLPRIRAVEKAGFSLRCFDQVVLNHSDQKYQWETLEKIGVPRSKVINISPQICLTSDELIVPSLKSTNESFPSGHAEYLREKFLGSRPLPTAWRRLFISRKDASQRRLSNEDEVFGVFSDYGFERVSLSGMSVREQALMFSEAKIIAGPSGAAFANLVFASPATQVFEFATPEWPTVFHWMISSRLALRHTIILVSEGQTNDVPNIRDRSSHFRVDPKKVARLLAEHLDEQFPQPFRREMVK